MTGTITVNHGNAGLIAIPETVGNALAVRRPCRLVVRFRRMSEPDDFGKVGTRDVDFKIAAVFRENGIKGDVFAVR